MHRGEESRPGKPAVRFMQTAVVALVAAILLGLTGCEKLRARDHLSKGVQAYKNGKYETAIEQFQQAVQHDPGFLTAKLYLAAAYANQVQQDVTTDENIKNAQRAIDAYQDVLKEGLSDKNKLAAYKQLQSIYWKIKKPDQAQDWAQKSLQLDPNDPDTVQFIGIVDWYYAYHDAQEIKQAAGLKLDPVDTRPNNLKEAMVKNPKVCDEIRAKNQKHVEDGIQKLKRAVELRPDNDDAFTYLNLIYRRKADLECGDEQAYIADIDEANKALDRALAIRKQKEQQKAAKAGGASS
jgi:tetratricopeptide (TPR) repeat protein